MTTLTQANIDRLNDVGFTWTFDRAGQKSWEERYQDLCAFQRENGHCNVPRKEGVFGEWVRERDTITSDTLHLVVFLLHCFSSSILNFDFSNRFTLSVGITETGSRIS